MDDTVTHPNKRRGDTFERAVVEYLRGHGAPNAMRAFGAGRRDDIGDILGVTLDGQDVAVQCRNTKAIDLADAVDTAHTQATWLGTELGVAIVKRRQRPIEQAYVVMDLAAFCRLVA